MNYHNKNLRLLSLYGPWPYGPMALALWLWPYGPIFLFQETLGNKQDITFFYPFLTLSCNYQ